MPFRLWKNPGKRHLFTPKKRETLPSDTCITQDVVELGSGMKPSNGVVAKKPCKLFLGIDTGILADTVEGERQIPFAVEMSEHLLISYGVQAVEMPVRDDAPGFFHKTLCHHHVHPSVDAVEEFSPFAVQSDFDNPEGPFPLCSIATALLFTLSERCERTAGGKAYLKRMYHPDVVFEVATCGVLGVSHTELVDKILQAIGFETFLKPLPHLGIDIGHAVDSLAYGIDVKHASARKDQMPMRSKELFKQGKCLRLIARSTVLGIEGECSHKIVFHPALLLEGRCSRSDGNVAEHLPAVGTDDGRSQAFGQFEGHRGFSDGCGSGQDKKRMRCQGKR